VTTMLAGSIAFFAYVGVAAVMVFFALAHLGR
jgi:hypothetical protein